jgi:hypothetical protein
VNFVLAPVGTANLLAGAFLAARDWGERYPGKRPKVIGVLPRNKENILRAVNPSLHKNGDDHISDSPMAQKPPLAPKLTGVYSPLAYWVYTHSLKQPQDKHGIDENFPNPEWLWFAEVDQAEQISVGARLLAVRSPDRAPAAEPSAIVGLAGVAPLAEELRVQHARLKNAAKVPKAEKAVCLTINSGFGLLTGEEREFYHNSLLALG